MEPSEICFNRPAIVGRELEYIRRTVEANQTSGDGAFTKRCRKLLRESLGVEEVLLTTSCTDALEMCALLLDLGPGDEFVVPSYSFVSTANAFALRGARPVFADIRPDTLNLDESRLESLITPRTKAVVLVHYAGVGCEMDELDRIASEHSVTLVEDNAHGLFGSYRGRQLGTFAPLATQSFHETKNFTCGEGGALVINDRSLIPRAEILRDKGTNRQQLFRGQVDKYSWVDLGSSFVMSDILAAYLFAQLEQRDSIFARRRKLWEFYDSCFRGRLESHGVQLPTVPPHCDQAYHMYYLMLPSLENRQALIGHLQQQRISAVFHYTPLHSSKMGRLLAGTDADCPVTERVSATLLRLPFHHELRSDEQERVVAAVDSFFRA